KGINCLIRRALPGTWEPRGPLDRKVPGQVRSTAAGWPQGGAGPPPPVWNRRWSGRTSHSLSSEPGAVASESQDPRAGGAGGEQLHQVLLAPSGQRQTSPTLRRRGEGQVCVHPSGPCGHVPCCPGALHCWGGSFPTLGSSNLGDLSGHLLAYLSLSPIFVIIGFVTLIIFKRELHTISFLGGLALNEGVNWLIKHVIQEPRPCGGPHAAVGTKYGMPSSHSQFMWFFSVYSFLFLYLRMHQTNNARFLDLLWRHLLSLGLLTAAFLVSYSRVYLLYHTWSQVLYGGVAGSLMAVAWFVFTQEVLTPLFPRIAAW
uniref:Dolichyldiphosphatase n=1 Tax=Oryctolagus cuniculus TaxID=9986 RepID=G1TQK4_RABIT